MEGLEPIAPLLRSVRAVGSYQCWGEMRSDWSDSDEEWEASQRDTSPLTQNVGIDNDCAVRWGETDRKRAIVRWLEGE